MAHVHKPPTAKQLKNEQTLALYALFLCGLILAVVAVRWLRTFCRSQTSPHGPRGLSSRAFLKAFRQLENRSTWKRFGRPSVGLVVLVGVYFVSNVVLSSNMLAEYRVNHWASRLGWLGAANMALCVFFGLKNTPLSLLTAVSHTQLNTFHRIVGYTTLSLVLLHAIFYTIHFGRQGRWEALLHPGNREGLGAGVAMSVLLLGVLVGRPRRYGLFYATHIAGFVAAVVLTALHRPSWRKKLPVVMSFIACMWVTDRVIRAARTSYNLVNNQTTFHPLPDRGTRLLLKKSPHVAAALPGSHCFLWIPRLSLYQTHPFTIVSNGPSGLELVIKAHKGFTRSIHDFATRHPGGGAGVSTWASVDAPYGTLPDTTVYDKLVLIAGGSGAAFTFGLMNRILDRIHAPESVRSQSVDFVWAVKRTEHLTWFRQHLHNLTTIKTSSTAVNVMLYVTSEEPAVSAADDTLTTDSPTEEDQKQAAMESNVLLPEEDTPDYHGEDGLLLSGAAFKGGDGVERVVANVEYQRMCAETVIREAVQAVGVDQRVLVATCGPKSLMDAVSDSADRCRTQNGCSIDVHCEDFGG